MNSTFKVVFNKARGALMVVNEVTSSVQAKGTKTVVAAAVAVAGALAISANVEAAEYKEAQGKDVTVTASDITSEGDWRILGGWRDWSDEAESATLGNTVTVESGAWNMAIGGHYSKVTDNPVSPAVEKTNLVINGGSVYAVVGGTGGSDNKAITHKNENAVTNVTINGGSFGAEGETGNCTEVFVLGGDLLKHSGDYNGGDINRYGESHIGETNITINDGTFNSAIVGGSAAIVYYGNANKGNKTTVDKTNVTINGGTFNHGIVAGGLASGHQNYSIVTEANLTIQKTEKDLVFNNGIYAGGLLRNDSYGNPSDSGVTVNHATVRIEGAAVGDVYGTHAALIGVTSPTNPNNCSEWIYKPLLIDGTPAFVKTDLTLINTTAENVLLGEGSTLTVGGVNSIEKLDFTNAVITGIADETTGSSAELTVGSADLGDKIFFSGSLIYNGTLGNVDTMTVDGTVKIANKNGPVALSSGNVTLKDGADLTLEGIDTGTYNGVVGGAGGVVTIDSESHNAGNITINAKTKDDGVGGNAIAYMTGTINANNVTLNATKYGIYTTSTGGDISVHGEESVKINAGQGTQGNCGDGVLLSGSNTRIITITSKGDVAIDGRSAVQMKDGGTVNVAGKNVVLSNTKTNDTEKNTEDPRAALRIHGGELNIVDADTPTGKVEIETIEITAGTGVAAIDARNNAALTLGASDSIRISGDVTGDATSSITLTKGDMSVQDGKVSDFKGTFTMEGGSLTLNDKTGYFGGNVDIEGGSFAAETVKLAEGQKLSINGGVYTSSVVELHNPDSVLNIGEGQMTLGSLTAEKGSVTVSKGTLTVDGDFVNAEGNVQVTDAVGTINLSLADIFEKTEDGYQVKDTFASIANIGTVAVLDDLSEVTLTTEQIQALKEYLVGKDSKGLVNLGNFKFAATDEEKGSISVDDIKDIAGIETDELKGATVTGVTSEDNVTGSFGSLELAEGQSTASVSDGTLKLNADGALVTNADGETADIALGADATLVTTGDAVTGNITGNGTLVVNGDLRADTLGEGETASVASIKVGELSVEAGATLNSIGTVDVAGTADLQGNTTVSTLTAEDLSVGQGVTLSSDTSVSVSGEASVEGTAAVAKIEADTLNVADNASVAATEEIKAGNLYVAEDAYLAATGTEGDAVLTVTGSATILGTAVADTLSADGATVYVGTDESGASAAASLVVKTLDSGTIFADPDWDANGELTLDAANRVAVETVAATGSVIAGRGSLFVIGSTDQTKVTDALTSLGVDRLAEGELESVAFIDASEGTIAGNVIVSGWDRAQYEAATEAMKTGVQIYENNLMIIDAATVGDDAVFDKAVSGAGDVYLANMTADKTLKLSNGDVYLDADQISFAGDVMMDAVIDRQEGTLRLEVAAEEHAELGLDKVVGYKAAAGLFVDGANLGDSKSAKFNNWLWSDSSDINSVTEMQQIARDAAAVGATAGVINVTMDALSAFNDTVANRTSILAGSEEGVNVWADVNGGRYQAKTLMNGAGYASDIYAGVIGADWTAACGGKLGAALTVGTADTDSKNTTAAASTDSDLFGLSVYASKTVGDAVNVAVDFGYMKASNEVSTKAYDLGKFDADSDAWTFGVRAELLTKAGAFDIVPHAGLRWTRLSVDSYEAGFMTDFDNMNVFQMPIGVTVAGSVETNGWTFAPKFDLTFVPAWGDKNADMTLGITGSKATDEFAVKVIDSNPVQATLGVSATNGAWTFGLDYKLGAGSDDRLNNSFNARVNYAF